MEDLGHRGDQHQPLLRLKLVPVVDDQVPENLGMLELVFDHSDQLTTHLAKTKRSAWRAALASLSRLAKREMADGDESSELLFSSVNIWREIKVHFRGSKG